MKGPAMSSAGFFNNYVRGRDSLYESMERRRARLRGMGQSEIGQSQVDAILEDIGEVKLAVATVINLLIAKGAVTEAELLEQARVIDAMDGSTDGQFSGKIDPDGSVAPDKPRPRTDLDDLADAVEREK